MPKSLENPFADYEAPAIHRVFSTDLKKEMTNIKFLRIVDHVKEQVSEHFDEYEFREGLRIYTSTYECTDLDPYFGEEDAKLRFLRDAIATGFSAGLDTIGIEWMPLCIGRKFEENDPKTARITVSAS